MTRNTFFFLLLLVLVSACSDGYQVKSWKAPGADYKKYRTYSWAAPGDTALTMVRKDKLFAGTIYLHTNAELKKKGMVFVKARPDAVFMFDTQVQDRTRYEQSATLSVGVGYGGPGYYVGGSAPVAGGKITEIPYKDAGLIIEMFDGKTQELVWRGWAERSIDYTADLDQIIRRASQEILFQLPVKNKK